MRPNRPNKRQPARARDRFRTTEQYVVQHYFGWSTKLQTTLTHAISDVTGEDVTHVEHTLGNSIDLPALDRLFDSSGERRHVRTFTFEFELWGYTVTISDSGRIVITPRQDVPA